MNVLAAAAQVAYDNEVDAREQLMREIGRGDDEAAFRVLCELDDSDVPFTEGFDDIVAKGMIMTACVYMHRSQCPFQDLFKAICMSSDERFIQAAVRVVESSAEPSMRMGDAIAMRNAQVVRRVLGANRIGLDFRYMAHLAAQRDNPECLFDVLDLTPAEIRAEAAAYATVTMVTMTKGHLQRQLVRLGIDPRNEGALSRALVQLREWGRHDRSMSIRRIMRVVRRDYEFFVQAK